mmetsp:Transcript_26813/g.87985  ORF Transcript_26813/g.87985 Transcript_26813/m.87985 type:complete len:200 (-) Transcript_26813:2642-3241(-)
MLCERRGGEGVHGNGGGDVQGGGRKGARRGDALDGGVLRERDGDQPQRRRRGALVAARCADGPRVLGVRARDGVSRRERRAAEARGGAAVARARCRCGPPGRDVRHGPPPAADQGAARRHRTLVPVCCGGGPPGGGGQARGDLRAGGEGPPGSAAVAQRRSQGRRQGGACAGGRARQGPQATQRHARGGGEARDGLERV